MNEALLNAQATVLAGQAIGAGLAMIAGIGPGIGEGYAVDQGYCYIYNVHRMRRCGNNRYLRSVRSYHAPVRQSVP